MARTKQTARKCLVRTAPRKQIITGKKRPSLKYQSDQEPENQVNNQQFSLKFDDQIKCQSQSISNQIIHCKNCQAILTSQSKILNKKTYENLQKQKNLTDIDKQKFLKNVDRTWICQFCLNHNQIPEKYEVASPQNPCFLIQKKKNQNKKTKIQEEEKEDQILIFCIDISSSMVTLVGNKKSRLDIVKQSIVGQLDRIKFQNPQLKVGIVLFGSIVSLIGDGTKKSTSLPTQIYNDFEKIVKESQKIKNYCSSLQKSYKKLRAKVEDLSIYGSTALGPALLASIQIASTGGMGSKVIICTDGQANVGVGSKGYTQQQIQTSKKFYDEAAAFAKKKNVSVSCLSLKGDKCNLKYLGKLSLATSGSLLKIDPQQLGTQFAKITKEQIIGTQSMLKIKVNRLFEIISEDKSQISKDKTTLSRDFGNFSVDTQLTFEFKVLSKQDVAKSTQIDIKLFKQQKVPMQVQLAYTGRDGNKYLQVITDWRQLTENQDQLYDGASFEVFSTSILQKASMKIKNKEHQQAAKLFKGYWQFYEKKFQKQQKKSTLKKFSQMIKKLEQVLRSKQIKSGNKSKIQMKKKSGNLKKSKLKGKADKQRQRSRSREGSNTMRMNKRSLNQSDSEEDQVMSSDEEEQIIFKSLRLK